MNDLIRKRQELCERLVEREVLCCVSHVVSTLTRLAGERNDEDLDYDELLDLCTQADYETPGIYFIEQDADLDQLEEIADHFGDWEEILDDIGYTSYATEMEEQDEEPLYLFEWAKIMKVTQTLRRLVLKTVDDWDWVGRQFDIDPDYKEAYEHWVVTNWLARKLADKGEMTGDVLNLTVWGRCTTGQSISLDYVIEQIAADLWPEEWEGKK